MQIYKLHLAGLLGRVERSMKLEARGHRPEPLQFYAEHKSYALNIAVKYHTGSQRPHTPNTLRFIKKTTS